MSWLSNAFFGKSVKSDKDEAKEQQAVPEMTGSPFSFLDGVPQDRVDIVHAVIKSTLPAQEKNDVLECLLKGEPPLYEKYLAWGNQLWKVPPSELKNMMSESDLKAVCESLARENYTRAITLGFQNSEAAGDIIRHYVNKVENKQRTDLVMEEAAKIVSHNTSFEIVPPSSATISSEKPIYTSELTYRRDIQKVIGGLQKTTTVDTNPLDSAVDAIYGQEPLTPEKLWETTYNANYTPSPKSYASATAGDTSASSFLFPSTFPSKEKFILRGSGVGTSPASPSLFLKSHATTEVSSRSKSPPPFLNLPLGPSVINQRKRTLSPLKSPQKKEKEEIPKLPEVAPRSRAPQKLEKALNIEIPKPKSPEKPKEPSLNILLLGETGVGKTTFINGLANYLKYQTMDDAQKGEATVPVPAAFIMADKKNKARVIRVEATGGGALVKENELLENKGMSCTQDPVTHTLRWPVNGVEKLVKIIDTPGMNETRGPEQDEKNFDKILKHIRGVGCILMKPNESKFTVAFRSCLDNLLVKLHKSATDNILFCFTNTRSTLYRPGDTLSTLHEYLKKVEKESGVIITADKNNILCFDNDCFRYLCVLRVSPKDRTESSFATFSEGWMHNVQESAKLLMKVEGLTPHVAEDTVSITNTRKLVTALARPLAEIAKNHLVNKKLIEQRIQEIENLDKTGSSLAGCMNKKQVVMVAKQLPKPRTICTAPSCSTEEKINQFETRRIPKVICHDKCYLTGSQNQSVNNSALADCSAFRNGKCTKCGCDWKLHMHITYEFLKDLQAVFDKEAMGRLMKCKDKKARAEMLLNEEREKMEELVRELDHIREVTAEFNIFLCANSMKLTCDPYADYLEYLIREEEEKFSAGGCEELLYEFWDVQEKYKKRVSHIKEAIDNNRRSAATTSQLKNMIDNLGKLKQCGSLICKVKEIQASGEPGDQDDGEETQLLSDDFSKNVGLGPNGKKPSDKSNGKKRVGRR